MHKVEGGLEATEENVTEAKKAIDKEMTKDRYKMIYLALLEAAMRYREGYWREEVDQYRALLKSERNPKNVDTREKLRKADKKLELMVLEYQNKIEAVNRRNYKEVEEVTATLTQKSLPHFDNYATGFGLILEKYIDTPNTKDLLMVCELYNKGLLGDVSKELKRIIKEQEEKNEKNISNCDHDDTIRGMSEEFRTASNDGESNPDSISVRHINDRKLCDDIQHAPGRGESESEI